MIRFTGMLLVFLIGLCAGSLANAWIWRTREGMPMLNARSVCPRCRHQIAWYDNIPLVSFFLLRRRCRQCNQIISWQYPLIELGLGLLFLLLFWHLGFSASGIFAVLVPPSLTLWRYLAVVFFLACIFVYDLRYMEIPDRFTLIPGALLLAFSLFSREQSPASIILGIVAGAGFFLLQYLVSRGRWIGGGDIRLGAFMGVILGWPRIIVGLLVAYVIGAVVSLALLTFKKKHLADATPFGTYLTVGTLLAMLWGERVIQWYASLLAY